MHPRLDLGDHFIEVDLSLMSHPHDLAALPGVLRRLALRTASLVAIAASLTPVAQTAEKLDGFPG